MMIIISLFFAIFVADNFVQIVVPDINLDNLFASCFFGQLLRNWLFRKLFAKVVKREVIKNIFYGQSDGRRKGGGYSYRVQGGQGVGLQGPMGSRR